MALAGDMKGVETKVFRQDHRGAGAARNRALIEVTCRYVAFLDADDEWLPEKLERSMERLEGSDYVLIAHDVEFVRDGTRTPVACAPKFEEGKAPFVTLYRKGFIGTSTVVARRDAVIAAGGFDETLLNAQDFDLWLAMLEKPGTPFLVFEGCLSTYHVTRGSIMSDTGRRLRCSMVIAKRYAPALKAWPGSVLASLWMRVLAVHYEAFRAFLEKKSVPGLLHTCFLLPANLISATVDDLFGNIPARRRFLRPERHPTTDGRGETGVIEGSRRLIPGAQE